MKFIFKNKDNYNIKAIKCYIILLIIKFINILLNLFIKVSYKFMLF